MDNCQFTIGITAYKVSEYLEECWQSVINQTDSNWKAIIVLDGENDKKTKKIFSKIEHPKLKKIELPTNQGPYATRNTAISNCDTPWYCQLDGDDTLPMDTMENLNTSLKNEPTADYIYGHTGFFNKNYYKVNKAENLDPENLIYHPLFNAASPISLKLYRKLGGYCMDFKWINADWDFWIGAHEINAKGAFVDHVLYNRRVRKNNVGQTQFQRRTEVVENLIRRHPGFFSKNSRSQKCKAYAYERIAREHRQRGNRKEAKEAAKVAIQMSPCPSGTLKEIIHEASMSHIRYKLRRIARKIKLLSPLNIVE